MVRGIGGSSSIISKSLDSVRPCPRLLVPIFQSEQPLACDLLVQGTYNCAEVAMWALGGLVDLT